MDDKFKMTAKINGFATSLIIDKKQEFLYRSAYELLNARIKVYVEKYDKPYTDILNMVAYEFAVEYFKLLAAKELAPKDTIEELSKLLEGIDLE